jgi:hypothetical protein
VDAFVAHLVKQREREVAAETAERRGSPWVRIGTDSRVENVRTGLDAQKAPFCRFDLTGRDGLAPGVSRGAVARRT